MGAFQEIERRSEKKGEYGDIPILKETKLKINGN